MTTSDATLSASGDAAAGPLVGPAVRTSHDHPEVLHAHDVQIDIAESLRHICAHLDAAEVHGRSAVEMFAALGKNSRVRKIFGL